MKFSKLFLLAGLLLSLSGCATQPEHAAGDGFAAARSAYLAQDYERALALMKQEAEAGNPRAQYTLGYMYYNGQGVVPSSELALKWIRAAAAKGEPRALEALGRLASAATQPATPAEAQTAPRQIP